MAKMIHCVEITMLFQAMWKAYYFFVNITGKIRL